MADVGVNTWYSLAGEPICPDILHLSFPAEIGEVAPDLIKNRLECRKQCKHINLESKEYRIQRVQSTMAEILDAWAFMWGVKTVVKVSLWKFSRSEQDLLLYLHHCMEILHFWFRQWLLAELLCAEAQGYLANELCEVILQVLTESRLDIHTYLQPIIHWYCFINFHSAQISILSQSLSKFRCSCSTFTTHIWFSEILL